MAFVAIANFAQQNHELGYAFKFMRMIILLLVYLLGIWGFVAGILLFLLLVSTNRTISKKQHYLYPLIPLNVKDLYHLVIRHKKNDFLREDEKAKRTK